METYISMLKEIDKVIEKVNYLNLEEGELFCIDFQKRLEYIELLIQAKKTKESFQNPQYKKSTQQHVAPAQANNMSSVVYGTTSITDNDFRFGILRFSKISEVAKSLEPNSKILIKYREDNYQGSIPKAVQGRVNGLASLYKDHPELMSQRKITVQYDSVNKIMNIE